jgi:hypothetical protein
MTKKKKEYMAEELRSQLRIINGNNSGSEPQLRAHGVNRVLKVVPDNLDLVNIGINGDLVAQYRDGMSGLMSRYLGIFAHGKRTGALSAPHFLEATDRLIEGLQEFRGEILRRQLETGSES